MSIPELQARIEALSADIDTYINTRRQNAVLVDLERRKSAAQRALNALRDPVARLPLELSSAIFVQCLPESKEPSANDAPMLFLNVCNAWTDIALATHALWAGVNACHPMADLASLLDTWFKRAGSRALSVFLPEGHNPEVMAVIRRYAHQLQDLELCCDNREDLFERDVQSLPFLKTLKITGEAEGFTCSTAGTIAMLRACPALVKFTLEQVFYPLADFYHETEILVLPHLQYLKFHGNEHILRYVTLPALQKLFIPFLDPRCVVLDLVQLFRRSAAPVHTLVVDDLRRRGWTPQETQECLSLLPKLAHFTLVDPLDASMDHLITALADASNLLPNLSKLQVRLTHPRGPLGAWYHKLPGVLAARRTQIRTVRIVWKRGLLEKPSEEVAVNLRQLVADGMEIHIGTTDGNLI